MQIGNIPDVTEIYPSKTLDCEIVIPDQSESRYEATDVIGVYLLKKLQTMSIILEFSCSKPAEKAGDAYVMFRFYEINNSDRADNISASTDSQNVVKYNTSHIVNLTDLGKQQCIRRSSGKRKDVRPPELDEIKGLFKRY